MTAQEAEQVGAPASDVLGTRRFQLAQLPTDSYRICGTSGVGGAMIRPWSLLTVRQYGAAWNESDEGRRRKLLEQVWSDDGTCRDPTADVVGRDGLVEHIGGFMQVFEGRWSSRAAWMNTMVGSGSRGGSSEQMGARGRGLRRG